MTTILRVYRSGKLVATVDELGQIKAFASSKDKPFVAYPYIDERCRPAYGDTMQQERHWAVQQGQDNED